METKPTVYDLVRECLRDKKGKKKKGFTYGGTLEDYVHARHTAKASSASRMFREMEKAGELEVQYDAKLKGCVMYRLS